MKKNHFLIFSIISFSILFSNIENKKSSNELYITGEDGIIRMSINIMGHVKNPGSYLVYDGIDFMSAISMAGGYLQGANLKSIIIYNENGNKEIINLIKYLDSDLSNNNLIHLKPHDTIFIKQKVLSKFFVSSNLPSIILSFINVLITLDRTEN